MFVSPQCRSCVFARRWRLSRAAEALARGNVSVKAVAYGFGFTDSSHFHRAFVAHYGMSPTAYRGQAH